MECSTEDKPLRLLHLLRERGFKKVLCFTNSLQATHRLVIILLLIWSYLYCLEHNHMVSQYIVMLVFVYPPLVTTWR
jgi:hypothetical protein